MSTKSLAAVSTDRKPNPAKSATPKLLSLAAIGIVICLAFALPFVTTGYHLVQATYVLIYAIALLGLNLLLGYNGQLSLGHGAFYAIGAYVTINLINHAGLPYWCAIPIAAVLCLICGFLFGLPALRLEGHYLALATFALALATPQLLKNSALAKWTGGFMGMTLSPVTAPKGVPLGSDQWLYLFCLVYLLALYWAAWNLVRSRTGRAIIALRDHPIAATTMGINAAFYKSMVFGVSAMYAGVAGGLGLLAAQFVSPDSFDMFLSLGFVVGVVVGGIATISGAVYGAIFIQFVPDLASHISKSAAWAVYGITLIAFMYLLPNGVAGVVSRSGQIISRLKIGRAREKLYVVE